MLLIGTEVSLSTPFTVKKQVTLYATGLQGADKVVVEVVSISRSGPGGDYCCPGPVALPEVQDGVPLVVCGCDGVKGPVELTATQPWVVINAPRSVPLRARKIADDDAVIEVELHETDGCSNCCA